MKSFAINVTSECISAANGRPYNSGKFEGSNARDAESAKSAIEAEIAAWRLENVESVEWFDEEDPEIGPSAVVVVALEDGGKKHYFFN
jgi:hypothetical protein